MFYKHQTLEVWIFKSTQQRWNILHLYIFTLDSFIYLVKPLSVQIHAMNQLKKKNTLAIYAYVIYNFFACLVTQNIFIYLSFL